MKKYNVLRLVDDDTFQIQDQTYEIKEDITRGTLTDRLRTFYMMPFIEIGQVEKGIGVYNDDKLFIILTPYDESLYENRIGYTSKAQIIING